MSCIATVCDDADDMLLYQRITVQNSLNRWSYSDTPCAFKKTLMSMCLGFAPLGKVCNSTKSLSCKYAPTPSVMSLPLCLRRDPVNKDNLLAIRNMRCTLWPD